jgi:hypothetical protein
MADQDRSYDSVFMKMHERKPVHDCPCCTCGLSEVTWSDRCADINIHDVDEVAWTIISCSLDHSYDRPDDGVPYGLPDKMAEAARPIVNRHLSKVRPDWKEHTVDLDMPGREALFAELVQAFEALGP